MNQSFFDGILVELAAYLASNRVVRVDDGGRHAEAISQAFPIGINRIDWGKVPSAIFSSVADVKEPEARQQRMRQFLRDAFSSASVGEEDRVVWVGDSTDFVLEMSVVTLSECVGILFSYPQHAYVIPPDASWCLSLTMEGELCFGRTPTKRHRGK